jgi:hypothetical protein
LVSKWYARGVVRAVDGRAGVESGWLCPRLARPKSIAWLRSFHSSRSRTWSGYWRPCAKPARSTRTTSCCNCRGKCARCLKNGCRRISQIGPSAYRVCEMRDGNDYDAGFATRMRGTGVWADLMRQRPPTGSAFATTDLNCWILPDSGRRREGRGPQTIHKVPCYEQAPLTASPGAARYRNIQGQSWDGISKMPDWL